jgi:hypothetical protein
MIAVCRSYAPELEQFGILTVYGRILMLFGAAR